MRKSFLEAYRRVMSDARSTGKPVKWFFSGGHDATRHEGVLREGIRRGLIEEDDAKYHCPDLIGEPEQVPRLTGETGNRVPPDEVAELIRKTKERLGVDF